MSKPVNINETLTFIPNGNTGTTNLTASSSYPSSNGNTSHTSSTYVQFTTQTTAGYTYYTFPVSGIPSNATISSVSCIAKIRINNTNRVSNTNIQLYSGTTAKGTSQTFSSTDASNTVTLNGGTWTISEVNNARLRFGGTRTSSNNNGYIYFYGATLSVTYTLTGTAYTITATSSIDGITATPATQDVMSGENAEAIIIEGVSDLSDICVKDNNVDVTDQLVQHEYESSSTASTVLGTYTLVSGSFNGSGATYFQGLAGKGIDNTKTTSNYYSGGSGTIAVFTYNLSFNDIPSNATITRLYLEVNGHAESTSNNNEYMCVQLLNGSTAISSELNFKSIGTSNSTQTIEATTLPTVAQLNNLKVQCRLGYYGGAINGATCYVVYEVPSAGTYYYTYTLTNVVVDHIITIDEAGAFIPPEEDPQYNYYPITISSINATTNPRRGTVRVVEGSNQTISIYPDDPLVTLILDNGVDVSSQLQTISGTPPSYTVATAPGASYGFNLNSSTGYYVSTNAGVGSSASVARVNLNLPVRCLVKFTFINSGEATYDFGVFGKVDTTLSTNGWTSSSSAGDTTTDAGLEQLRCNTSSYNSTSTQTLNYEINAGEHYIDVKYGKDQSSDSDNDSLQFKLEIETLESNNNYTYTLNNISESHSLIFVFGDVTYWYVNSSGSGCKLYPNGQFVVLDGESYKLTIVPDDTNSTISLLDNNVDVSSRLERVESQVEKDGSTITYVNYIYNLSNISATHNLVISSAGNYTIYLKVNGSWITASKIYKKIDDRWQEQSEFSNLFDSDKIYIKV